MVMKDKFDVIRLSRTIEVEKKVSDCKQKGHFQQVVYSVHRMTITSICFGCEKIYTTN